MEDILLRRPEWGASAPLGLLMRLPAVGVHVHHSVTSVNDPVSDMLELERIGVQRFGRFSYSFCGHPDGTVGEGAGLHIGAHTANWNSTTFGYCFIGNYEERFLTSIQKEGFRRWRYEMIANGFLRADAWMIPHGDRASTACPGRNVRAEWAELQAPWIPPIPPPANPPKPKYVEEDMLLFEKQGEDRGIWVFAGDTALQLGHHETVSSLLSAGVKTAKFKDSDFDRFIEAVGRDDALEVEENMKLDDIKAAVENN